MNREFLMLAKTYDPSKHKIGGWFVSEKLDGIRCFWDGGCSWGLVTDAVPWSNPGQKDVICTGLWTRYGNVIRCPTWFTDKLPTFPLDGELWTGVQDFQEISSIVRRHTPDERWGRVKFVVFDSPQWLAVGNPGKINNPNFKLEFTFDTFNRVLDLGGSYLIGNYEQIYTHLQDVENLTLHPQLKLPDSETEARECMEGILDSVVAAGGEGLILRRPNSYWWPERVDYLLKVKPCKDAEGIVIGWIWGRGKYEGMLGALILDYNGKRLELSGMNDSERVLVKPGSSYNGRPGSQITEVGVKSVVFPFGSRVTFKYRELTKDGIPKEAHYWRH